MIHTAVASGRLHRVRRGVYLDPAEWPHDLLAQHLLRAHGEQVFQPDSVVSHRSAAGSWGIPVPTEDWSAEPVWITLPAGREFRSERSPRVIQSVAPLPSHQVTLARSGFRVTTPARTAADLARDLELPESLMVLDAGLRLICQDLVGEPRRRDFRNPRLVAAAKVPVSDAMARPRMAGALQALGFADPSRESAVESLSFGHMVLAGLPLPACQFPLETPLGTLYPDFYWEERCLIGEVDGRIKYSDPFAIVREKEREQVLRDFGYRIVRWLGKEIYLRPAEVLARIIRSLEA